jgi:hypothetical protein
MKESPAIAADSVAGSVNAAPLVARIVPLFPGEKKTFLFLADLRRFSDSIL